MFNNDSFIKKIETPEKLNLMKCIFHIKDYKLISDKQNYGRGFSSSRLYIKISKLVEYGLLIIIQLKN